jgi:hypothetical protein
LENLRSLATLAHQKGDVALCAFTAVLEGLALLKTAKVDSLDRVQECLAKAAKYQLNPLARIFQVDILVLLLDLACSMHQRNPELSSMKLTALQKRMDEDDRAKEWQSSANAILLPIKRLSGSQTISVDTSAIIRPGGDSEAHDYLVMSFIATPGLYILGSVHFVSSGSAADFPRMTLSGLAVNSRLSSGGKVPPDFWKEALDALTNCERTHYRP